MVATERSVSKREERPAREPEIGDGRVLDWGDRIAYAIVFAALLFAMFFMEGGPR